MKVSCILPTRGRQEWARQAVMCFQSQTYSDKELCIVDDADDPSFPEGIDSIKLKGIEREAVWHKAMPTRLSIPEKRHACCELATGDVLAHFDSDDWSDPNRLMIQMELMQQSGKQVIGFHTMLFYDVTNGKVYKYHGWSGMAIGTSLFYRREFWQAHPWNQIKVNGRQLASDFYFVRAANSQRELHSVDGRDLMVARAHPGDTGQKQFMHTPFKEVSLEELPAGFPR